MKPVRGNLMTGWLLGTSAGRLLRALDQRHTQELLGQFARPHSPAPVEVLASSAIDKPTLAADYQGAIADGHIAGSLGLRVILTVLSNEHFSLYLFS